MGKVILGFTMSLDGFINDQSGSVGSLYCDLAELRDSESLGESIRTTGAVVMGRHAFEMGDPDEYAENYEYQVPIFVLTRNIPKKQPKQTEKLSFTFIPDGIENAIGQAKIAAGEKNVTIIGGASVARQCIMAGLVDEIHIDIMPVLLCGGLRLFDQIGEQPIRLEKITIYEAGSRTELRFRVIKENHGG